VNRYLLTTGELARYVVSALKTHPDERARTEIQLIVELLKETAFVKQLGQLGAWSMGCCCCCCCRCPGRCLTRAGGAC
jgi:hypothetical protein